MASAGIASVLSRERSVVWEFMAQASRRAMCRSRYKRGERVPPSHRPVIRTRTSDRVGYHRRVLLSLALAAALAAPAAGAVERVGVGAGPAISANGRYVAFASDAPDLVPED